MQESDEAIAKSVADLEELVAKANALLKSGDRAAAREACKAALAAAGLDRATPEWLGAADSALWQLGLLAYRCGDLRVTHDAWAAVNRHREATLPDDHPDLQTARQNLASAMAALGDLAGALALEEKVLAIRSRTLPDDHPDVQAARLHLSITKKDLGDLPGALALQEKVLAVRSKTLPDDHPDVQLARLNLASTRAALGDLPGALALQETVFAVRSRTLPDDHPDLQVARQNLAATKCALGDLPGGLGLLEKVLAVDSRTLPDDHPDLQAVRNNLANIKFSLGDLAGALALQEQVLAVLSQSLPDDHPYLQLARGNLALTRCSLGDLAGALALQEKVLAVSSKTLPDDHLDLQSARGNLASTKAALGDLPSALVLNEKVLTVFTRTLPDDHPYLQLARGNLAAVKFAVGDLPGALALQEKVLAVCSQTLPDDHPDLQLARGNLANAKYRLGDLQAALVLQEKVLAVCARTLPDDHPDLQRARLGLAATKLALGDLPAALSLQEKVFSVDSKTLPDDHPDLQSARENLACTKTALGDLQGARALLEKALAVRSQTLPDDHPDLQLVRLNLATTMCAVGDLSRAANLNRSAMAGALRRLTTQSVSGRDVTELSRQAATPLSQISSLLDLRETLPIEIATALRQDAMQLLEATRSAELLTDRLRRAVHDRHPDAFARLAPQLAATSHQLEDAIGLPPGGRSAPDGRHISRDDAIREATLTKDALDRELLALVPDNLRVSVTPAEFAVRLDAHEAAVSFLTYTRWTNDPAKPWITTGEQRYGALVLAPSGEVTWHSLARVDAVDALIAGIRSDAVTGQALASRSPGASTDLVPGRDPEEAAAKASTLGPRLAELRRLLFDPVLAALPEGTDALVLSLADEMQLMPIDDLPLSSGKALGEAFAVRSVWSLRALMEERGKRADTPTALVLGGADYDSRPEAAAPIVPEAATPIVESIATAGTDRSDPGTGSFAPLPGTKTEAESLAATFAKSFPDHTATTLLDTNASEAAFVEQAPGKTFLHLATHGYFAPEDAWRATDAKEPSALARFDIGQKDRTAQLSPYSLAGIALAGANLPADELGHREGILTAQEIVQLDLQQCYLATLSACETSLGVRRAGTGLASLRQAFHAAGARYVLATLWKVNDQEAERLMADFYDRLWRQGQDPRTALREAKDAAKKRGAPFRDWAGWVLTGR